jgi:2-acylglycerol O-acyltransferase 2
MLFWPIVGLILRLYGVQSVHGSHMKKLMKEGKNIGLLPGGFEEATLTTSK